MKSFPTKLMGIGVAIAMLIAAPAAAQTPEQFYSGNTVYLLIGASPGGGQDTQARLVARYLERYIPGNPTVVAQNMPGGGQRRAVEHLYNVAPQDGTFIGQVHPNLPMWQLVEESVQADAGKFQWLGSPGPIVGVMGAWHTTGIDNLEEALATEFTTSSSGAGTLPDVVATVINEVLGGKIQIIRGYAGSAEQDLAMERGEIQSRYHNWASVRGLKADWLEQNLYKVFVQMGGQHPDLPDTPVLELIPDNPADRQVIDLLVGASHSLGRPYAVGPGVPADRVAALREAFAAVMADPDFIAEAVALEMEIAPFSATELQAKIEAIVATPPDVVARARDILAE